MVKVYPIGQKFRIDVDKISFVVLPLRYAVRSEINSQCVVLKEGKAWHDQSLSAFLTLKHSIKEVSGLRLPDGETPFLLEFIDEHKTALTDDCVETLLNCELGYVLTFYARQAIESTPHQILNPLTNMPLKDVSFTPIEDSKKKL